MSKLEVVCPDCGSNLLIDRDTGQVLWHKRPEVAKGGSLESMVAGLETQKSDASKRFERELESQKDRSRILDEKFKAALEQAEKSDEKYVNPMDMD